MQSKFFFSCCVLTLLFSHALFAQIQVASDGEITTGNVRANQDYDNVMTVNIMGLGTDSYRTGARMAFGDIGGTTWGMNAFIGEFGGVGNDSDEIELHAKNGLKFTTGSTLGVVDMELKPGGNLYIRSALAQNVTTLSDVRFKSNIKTINDPIRIISQLNGKLYDFTPKQIDSKIVDKLKTEQPVTDKDKKAKEETLKQIEKSNATLTNQYGLVAQDVQKVLPSIVSSDEEGTLGVNYQAIIPILIEGIKEQQKAIEALTKRIEQLEKK